MKKLLPLILIYIASFTNTSAQIDWNAEILDVGSFSSPRVTDLNGDGIKDIVQGAGLDGNSTDFGVFALNGADGSILWTAFARDQIFGSPVFLDVNGDGTDDVFIGGRSAEFQALDGATGNVIWEFYPQSLAEQIAPKDSGVYQFYTPQIISDQDGDGLPDLLNANGGDPSALLPNDPRSIGRLMVISSATGELIAQADAPDGREIYMSPLIADFFRDGDHEIIFGTGGEANDGSLWRVPLSDLMNGDISNATELIYSDKKGFIAPPCFADLNADNVPDIITNAYDGSITAINGRDNTLFWENTDVFGEVNSSPAIGYFNGDDIPDVYTSYTLGSVPTQILIDGQTGEVIRRDSIGLIQFASPLALDYDQDGIDEIVLSTNYQDEQDESYSTQILVIDFNDDTIEQLTELHQGANVYSTPYIGNLDNDGSLDVIYSHNVDDVRFVSSKGVFVKKQSLSIDDTIIPSWGAYLGNNYDAVFYPPNNDCFLSNEKITFALNGGENCMTNAQLGIVACEGVDCDITWDNGDTGYSTTLEGSGRHTVRVGLPDGCVRVAKIDIPEFYLDGFEQTNNVCADGEGGSIRVDYSGGQSPYQIYWNNEPFGGQSVSGIFLQGDLANGTYIFEVFDKIGCSQKVDFEIINENTAITVDWNSPEPDETNMGSLNINIDGGTPPYSVSLDDENVEEWTSVQNLTNESYSLLIVDSLGCQYSETVQVNLFTGINSILNGFNWSIYPNPSTDVVYISFPENELATSEIGLRMYDATGRLIFSDAKPLQNSILKINTAALVKGIYFIELELNGYNSVKMLSIIH